MTLRTFLDILYWYSCFTFIVFFIELPYLVRHFFIGFSGGVENGAVVWVNGSERADIGLFGGDFGLVQFEFFFICVFLILLVGFVAISASVTSGDYYFKSTPACLNLVIFSTLILLLLEITTGNNCPDFIILNGAYSETLTSCFFKLFLIICSLVFLIVQAPHLRIIKDFEFIVFIYICIFASCLMVNVGDLMAFFFVLELQSLILYILVAMYRESHFSTEGALKYFIIGSFASGLMLFGISLIYGFSGLYNFIDLMQFTVTLYLFGAANQLVFYGYFIGMLFLLIGFLFKLGVVPFHMWVPDAYEGSPLSTLPFIALIPKISGSYIFIKIFGYYFIGIFFFYQNLLFFVALASILWGSVAAIYQLKLKRFLAYSMIANIGYICLGFAIGDLTAIYVTFAYLLVYILIMFGIFISLTTLREATTGRLVTKITGVVNLFEINPFLALCIAILLFSLAGIPPLLGFYPKFILFYFLLRQGSVFISILYILISAVTVFYYIRLVKFLYFNRSKSWAFYGPISYVSAFILAVVVLLNFCFFLNPGLFFSFILQLTLSWYV